MFNTKDKNMENIKEKINEYICKKDIGYKEEIDRKIIIKQIFTLYNEYASKLDESEHYLSHIDNDLVRMIGYRVTLKENKDIEGVKLWDELDRIMCPNNKVNEDAIKKILEEVPFYFLLSFLGYAHYINNL